MQYIRGLNRLKGNNHFRNNIKYVKYVNQLPIKIDKLNWVIPACFGLSCVLTITGIVLILIRGFSNMEAGWIFSISADIFCMAICVMLCFSCVLNLKGKNEQTYVFVSLLTVNTLAMFLDEVSWLIQGFASLRYMNIAVNVISLLDGLVLVYLFWKYIRKAMGMNNTLMHATDTMLNLLLIPTLLLCLVNSFYPLYFSVDEFGYYQRTDKWYISQMYLFVALMIVLLELMMSNSSRRDKMVAASFAAIPLVNQALTGYTYGLSTQYASMLVSVVLIYGVLFADREKTIASTELELGVATRIQSDMLPNTFPFLPERKEFDLYASMTPAKEVGGDFYDFFMIDDTRLALVVADVSGKGIPAALFMMSSKILIKNCVMSGESPAQVLATVNKQICENNREEMFVTVWLGILDLSDGTLTASNAGHEYPMLKEPDGDFEMIKNKHSFVVGGMKKTKYKEYEVKLKPDSKLFLYTDGIPEAEDSHEQQYGYERFLATLNKKKNGTPVQLLAAVSRDVNQFMGENPQPDDLTMLCVHYTGNKEDEVKELTVEAAVYNIEKVTQFVNLELDKLNCPPKAQTQIAVAIDELFGNIAKYAYQPEIGKATVRFEVEKNPLSVIITFIDNGVPFNPLEQVEPDTHKPLKEREAGGLGIFLVKKTMTMVEYEYKNNQNILKIKKSLE